MDRCRCGQRLAFTGAYFCIAVAKLSRGRASFLNERRKGRLTAQSQFNRMYLAYVGTEWWMLLVAGIGMSVIALVGGLLHSFSDRRLALFMPVLLGLSAGSLLGGALFHMFPHAWKGAHGMSLVWAALGWLGMAALDRLMHRSESSPAASMTGHRSLGNLILLGDGLHNLVGGLAVGSAFGQGPEAGWGAWAAAVLHELPQEIGDYGVLLHAGWTPRRALQANWLAALPFLAGLMAAPYLGSLHWTPALLAFGGGNFLYIALRGVVPHMYRCYAFHRAGWAALLLAVAAMASFGHH
jgi:zinc and cadmium transporter